MHSKKYRILIILCLLMLVLMGNCYGQTTDYSQADNWLALDKKTGFAVDVFYLLPTTYTPDSPQEEYADINNVKMRRRGANHWQIVADVFAGCNIFVPHYRQANALKILNQPLAKQDALLRAAPLQDVTAALDYYFERHNNGRPFILAGYSQGSALLRYVLAEYMREHPQYYKRMVAAYLIGYGVDSDYLRQNTHLRFAKAADDFGVIVSYNVEAPGLMTHNPLTMKNALSINPITWTSSQQYATKTLSQGALLSDANGVMVRVLQFADAQVNKARGTVMSNVDIDKFSTKMLGGVFPRGVYHGYDYQLYYFDIQKNVQQRIKAYFRACLQVAS